MLVKASSAKAPGRTGRHVATPHHTQHLHRHISVRSLTRRSAMAGNDAQGEERVHQEEHRIASAEEELVPLLQNVVGRTTSKLQTDDLTAREEQQEEEEDLSLRTLSKEVPWELREQAKMAGPLALGLIANYMLSVLSFSVVGQLGTPELAAAALGSTIFSMTGKIPLMGLCGALDTFASQAAGAGNYEALGPIFARTVLFLSLHAIPISGIFFGLPLLLRALGQSAELTQRVGAYLMALLPALWIDALYRPLNRILVAQRITLPQMWVGGVVAAQHLLATYLGVYTLAGGYLGAAYATVWSQLLSLLLLAGYVWAAGLQDRVWGHLSVGTVLQGWRAFTKLAYSSAAMKCIESWSFSFCTVVAGWLPDPHSAVAAIAVAFNLYGILFMMFSALSFAVSTRVGNALGAGKAALARLAVVASAIVTPLVWLVVAVILVTPACQRVLLGLFTNGADPLLLQRMTNLLFLVVVLELFDGGQTVMAGVVSGAGKQAYGFMFNAISYWLLALPAALLLAFVGGGGVEGLYSGMVLGPFSQCCCYLWLIWRLQWREEAAAARQRVLSTAS